MSLSEFMPDWAVMRQPWNWAVVLLASALFFFALNLAFTVNTKEGK